MSMLRINGAMRLPVCRCSSWESGDRMFPIPRVPVSRVAGDRPMSWAQDQSCTKPTTP